MHQNFYTQFLDSQTSDALPFLRVYYMDRESEKILKDGKQNSLKIVTLKKIQK